MSVAQQRSKVLERDGPDVVPAQAVPACWAAVSFLFQDAVWCDWLYREFDGTRVPRPLAGRPSRHGIPYPDRISVSPDPADPQQLETYAETLMTAQHLIIVVSPGSAREDLIQEHMRIFRAAGGEERIIALVVKGEPASPSADPGCEADREWMPKWLEWRFRNNKFESAPLCEPLVVDARLGASSLAEVRAQLCAAMLEVPVQQLAELGVAIRGSTANLVMQASQVILPMPEPTPLPTLSAIASPEVDPTPRHSRWPVMLCAALALGALGCLAFWPAKESEPVSTPAPGLKLRPQKAEVEQPATSLSDAAPLVAVVPVLEKPAATVSNEPASTPPSPVTDAVVAAIPQGTQVSVPPPAPTAPTAPTAPIAPATVPVVQSVPPPPSAGAVVEPGIPSVMSAAAEAEERKHYELASRRDRLVRLAESKGNAGETEEALAAFQQAIDTAHELVNRTDGGHDEVIEMALLYRRFGNFAAGVNSQAEGRQYFERGRRVLQALRVKGKLPKEAYKILSDLEAASKPGTRD